MLERPKEPELTLSLTLTKEPNPADHHPHLDIDLSPDEPLDETPALYLPARAPVTEDPAELCP